MAELSSFGEWLKRQRKVAGLTQEQLALQISSSTSALRKMEAEERSPSAQIVERLAEIFKIPQDERTQFLRFARGDWRAAPSERKTHAPWRASTSSPRSNLPRPPTRLIGREGPIANVHEYLSDPYIRLVTLLGPPGIGKTRLSVEAARAVFPDFPSGVFFVALATVDDPNLVAPTIIQALGFVETGRKSPIQRLKDGIGEKQMLLLLDNLEHIIEGVAPLVAELLLSCPQLKILTTSREALRVPGEWLYSVPALDVPTEGSAVDMETISEFPALTLFAERARAVRSDFTLSNENIQSVTAICAQLDGLPLAIELIAARIRLMSPQVLLERLSGQFVLSADGMRAVSARQKTLLDAIGWSYDLLPATEQVLFRRLAVFAGGWTSDEAQPICSEEGIEVDEVPGLLVHLADKSLVIVQEHKRGLRYQFLETIRQYAQEKLTELHEAEKVHNRHLDFFMKLAEQAEPKLHGAEQAIWLERLEMEQGNLRTALRWGLGNNPDAGLRLASALSLFWDMHSHQSEGLARLEELLSRTSNRTLARAKALFAAGLFKYRQGEYKSSRTLLQHSISICHELGDKRGHALALGCLSAVARTQGKYAESLLFAAESLALYQELDDRWGIANILNGKGELARLQGDYEAARRFYEESLALSRELGDRFGISILLHNLAYVVQHQGDYQRAKVLFEEGLTTSQEVGDKVSTALAVAGLAGIAGLTKEPKRAARLFGAVQTTLATLGIILGAIDRSDLERDIQMVKTQLDPPVFATLWEEGCTMSLEQAAEYALEFAAENESEART